MLRSSLFAWVALQVAAAPILLDRGSRPAHHDLEPGASVTLKVDLLGGDSPITWNLEGGGRLATTTGDAIQYRAPRAGGIEARVTATLDADPLQHVAFTVRVAPNRQPAPPTKVDLLARIKHVPAERNQGDCHNCYVWATTAALETELAVKYGLRERLSIEFFHRIYDPGLPGAAPGPCLANNAEVAVATYQKDGRLVPWDQLDAAFRPPDPAGPKPYHTIKQLSLTLVATELWSDEDVIAELKARLSSGKAVIFRSGGHYVTIMGYDASDPDPDRHVWVVLDSAGIRPDRPDATYRQPMRPFDYNFLSHHGQPEFIFEVLDLEAELASGARPETPPATRLTPDLHGLARMAAAYGSWRSEPRYQAAADLDQDGFVSRQDALTFLANLDAQP